MASLPIVPPLTARVDGAGRLVAADPPLLQLQEQAGARLGSALAVPQLAGLARLAARLGVAITRPVVAGSEEEDLELSVRAEPDADGVTLSVEQWTARPPSRPRSSGASRTGDEATVEAGAAGQDLATDAALRIISVSPGLARRLDQPEAEIIGQPLTRLLRPVEDADGNLPLLEALTARAPFEGQSAQLRSDGSDVLIDGSPRYDEGLFTGYSIHVRAPGSNAPAVTPVLPPLDDLLSEPLATIIGQAEEIAGRSQGPLRTDYAGYGADIAAAARHLTDLLAALGGSKADDPAAPAPGETLDLAELVLDAAGLVQPDAAGRRVLLDIDGEARLPARGLPRAITQILVNLIGNAVRFSPDGGSVTITLARNGAASVTVRDEGPGVARADRQRIFERFEQGKEARGGGAGLGLAISRRLAREMGGEVELLDGPGPGASFRLTLPAA